MKTKKELDSSKKAEGELQAAIVSLNAQLEGEKQLAEQGKVGMSVCCEWSHLTHSFSHVGRDVCPHC